MRLDVRNQFNYENLKRILRGKGNLLTREGRAQASEKELKKFQEELKKAIKNDADKMPKNHNQKGSLRFQPGKLPLKAVRNM